MFKSPGEKILVIILVDVVLIDYLYKEDLYMNWPKLVDTPKQLNVEQR
jgi:hypothetical protein